MHVQSATTTAAHSSLQYNLTVQHNIIIIIFTVDAIFFTLLSTMLSSAATAALRRLVKPAAASVHCSSRRAMSSTSHSFDLSGAFEVSELTYGAYC